MVGKKMSQQVVLENNGVGIGFYETLPNSQNSQMKLRWITQNKNKMNFKNQNMEI